MLGTRTKRPLYQRRQYNDLAGILKAVEVTGDDRRLLDELIMILCKRFQSDNPNFDFIKFMEASGYVGDT